MLHLHTTYRALGLVFQVIRSATCHIVEMIPLSNGSEAELSPGCVIIRQTMISPSLNIHSHEITSAEIQPTEHKSTEVGCDDRVLLLRYLRRHSQDKLIDVIFLDRFLRIPVNIAGTQSQLSNAILISTCGCIRFELTWRTSISFSPSNRESTWIKLAPPTLFIPQCAQKPVVYAIVE